MCASRLNPRKTRMRTDEKLSAPETLR
jgi:hypothetical protein